MIKLSFHQNESPMGGSFWQRDRLITHILFELEGEQKKKYTGPNFKMGIFQKVHDSLVRAIILAKGQLDHSYPF